MRHCNLRQVLRQIVESVEGSTKYNHQAFAVMEYFGYCAANLTVFILPGFRCWIRRTTTRHGHGLGELVGISEQIRTVKELRAFPGIAACGCQGLTITMSDSCR